MEQLQIPGAARLLQGYDILHVKFAVIGVIDTVLQFLFGIICEQKAHDFISHSAVIHPGELAEPCLKCGHGCGDIESSVLREAS